MHELSIAMSIVEMAQEEAERQATRMCMRCIFAWDACPAS